MNPPITLNAVTKHYGRTQALRGLTLSVEGGELFGLVGVNGAGKTTTLSLVLGFIQATSGSLSVLGLDPWKDAAQLHKSIAWLPGDVRLPGGLTGKDWLAYQADAGGLKRERFTALAQEWEVPLDRPMRTLSKGNRQKVALLRLLASEAPLLVLDEPTSGLDPVAQERLLTELRARGRAGTTVLFSSHSLSEVQALCDRMAVIDAGRVLRVGSVGELTAGGEQTLQVWTRDELPKALFGRWRAEKLEGRWMLHGDRLLEEAIPQLAAYGVERLEFGGQGLEGLLAALHDPNAAPTGRRGEGVHA